MVLREVDQSSVWFEHAGDFDYTTQIDASHRMEPQARLDRPPDGPCLVRRQDVRRAVAARGIRGVGRALHRSERRAMHVVVNLCGPRSDQLDASECWSHPCRQRIRSERSTPHHARSSQASPMTSDLTGCATCSRSYPQTTGPTQAQPMRSLTRRVIGVSGWTPPTRRASSPWARPTKSNLGASPRQVRHCDRSRLGRSCRGARGLGQAAIEIRQATTGPSRDRCTTQ